MAKAGLLFVGTEDGLVLFSDPGGVGRWLRVGQELRGKVVRAVALDANNPLVVLAGAEGIPLQRSEDGGQSWQAVSDVEAQTLASGRRHASQQMYLGAADGSVYRSIDAGAYWERCPAGDRTDADITCLIVTQEDAQWLYLGSRDGHVWTSPDGGTTWMHYGKALSAPISDLAVADADPSLVYALAGGKLYRCDDAGGQWTIIEGAPAAEVTVLSMLQGKVSTLLLGHTDGTISRSDDAGTTWTTTEVDASWTGSVNLIVAAHYNIDVAFAGSSTGRLAVSTDRGRSWHTLRQELPPVRSIVAARLA